MSLFLRKSAVPLLCLLPLFCSLAMPCKADEWTGPDKTKHFAVSALLGAAAYAVTEDKNQAFLLALAPGLAKELCDSTQDDNHFSGKDMLWNALGAAVGVQVGAVVFKPNEVSVSFKF